MSVAGDYAQEILVGVNSVLQIWIFYGVVLVRWTHFCQVHLLPQVDLVFVEVLRYLDVFFSQGSLSQGELVSDESFAEFLALGVGCELNHLGFEL